MKYKWILSHKQYSIYYGDEILLIKTPNATYGVKNINEALEFILDSAVREEIRILFLSLTTPLGKELNEY